MEPENTDEILRSNYIIDEFDHGKIKSISNILCDENKVNIMLRSKAFEGQMDQEVPFYGTKYKVQDFSPELKRKITHP